jgi:hypothetical protein
VCGDRGFEAVADRDDASPLEADADPPSTPVEVASVVPEPERTPDPETTSVAPEPEAPLVALVTLPVRSETTVVCEAIVEIAEVTVPTGSSCTPATAAPLDTPPSASTTKTRTRIAATRIHLMLTRFWSSKPESRKRSKSCEAAIRLKWTF